MIRKKIEEQLNSDQFDFRQGTDTRKAILVLRVLNVNRNTFITFNDLEKASDIVNCALLMNSMEEK